MAARSYRRFIGVLEKWPVDELKTGRDLGAHLRAMTAVFFPGNAELAQEAPRSAAECDADLRALEDIVNDKAKNLYVRDEKSAKVSSVNQPLKNLREFTSTETLRELGTLAEDDESYLASEVKGVFEQRKREKEAKTSE